ncbi:hypothetical protein VE04_09847, partial [Pseudogymnoascus sp. 24MN13]
MAVLEIPENSRQYDKLTSKQIRSGQKASAKDEALVRLLESNDHIVTQVWVDSPDRKKDLRIEVSGKRPPFSVPRLWTFAAGKLRAGETPFGHHI